MSPNQHSQVIVLDDFLNREATADLNLANGNVSVQKYHVRSSDSDHQRTINVIEVRISGKPPYLICLEEISEDDAKAISRFCGLEVKVRVNI